MASEAPSQNNAEPDLLTRPPESILIGDTYISALLKIERNSVSILPSVGKKLRKRTQHSINTIDRHRLQIDEAKRISPFRFDFC